MKKHALTIFIMLVFLAAGIPPITAGAQEFPGRAEYPGVPYISIEDLHAAYSDGKAVIVDVRSNLEFDTVHVKDAFHIPLEADDFTARVKAQAKGGADEKIAFYCNGITCYKSYKAAQKALDDGIKNVFAYDLGIPAWAEAYPDDTLLLGRILTESTLQWIPDSEFNNVSLAWEDFKNKIAEQKSKGEKYYIVDFRDAHQKKNDEQALKELSALGEVIALPLDEFIKNVVDKGEMKDGYIFGFDNVGKQVQWLMYYLEESFYSRYFFLSKGISGV